MQAHETDEKIWAFLSLATFYAPKHNWSLRSMVRTDCRGLLIQDRRKAWAPGWTSECLILVPDTEGRGSFSSLDYEDVDLYLHFKMHYFMAMEEKETATNT